MQIHIKAERVEMKKILKYKSQGYFILVIQSIFYYYYYCYYTTEIIKVN